MINTSNFRSLLAITCVLLLYGFNNLTLASNLSKASDRKGRWEASLLTRYVESNNIDFNGGAQAKLSNEWAFGFDVGYNFSENLALNFDVSWTDVDYTGTRIDDTGAPSNVSGRITTNNVNFRATYNFSKRRFTPFVGAAIGWMFVDSNVADGPPGSVCWWDPWWGYICSGYQPTKTSTDFSYGLQFGLRYAINKDLFVRGSIDKSWVDFNNTTSTPDFNNLRFDIGFLF